MNGLLEAVGAEGDCFSDRGFVRAVDDGCVRRSRIENTYTSSAPVTKVMMMAQTIGTCGLLIAMRRKELIQAFVSIVEPCTLLHRTPG